MFTYLPIERGDALDPTRVADAIRALYRTGFFQDVRLDRQGDVLVVTVSERPAINTLTVEGNKDIKSEDLLKGLRDLGLSEGETYDPLALDRVKQELSRQYNNRGKYNARIEPSVSRLGRNRVDLTIKIDEGESAKIKHINLVGNSRYEEGALRDDWELDESNWLSWYRRDDQYSREKLSGDLEKLNAFYLDRGHVDFSVDSTQVAMSTDRTAVYITAGLTEGEQYRVSSASVTGNTVLPEDQLQRLVLMKPTQVFSRAALERSSDAITATLGNIGYAFAEVNIVPEVDRVARTVAVELNVVPGPRVLVRRIAFKGNTRTSDEVLRRELRQFEGAWYSQAAIDRSKVRLQRLGIFETVEVETVPVAGSPDLLDLTLAVKETSSGEFQVGFGYSGDSGVTSSIMVTQRNLLGSGRSFSVNLNRSSTTERYAFSISEPYLTDSDIGLGYSLSWQKTRQDSDDDSSYDSRQGSIGATATIPLSEHDSLSLNLSADTRTFYLTEGYYPPSYFDFLDRVGGNRVDSWSMRAAWSNDSRNSFLAPTAGQYQSLSAKLALPGSGVEYYKLDYEYGRYWRIGPTLLLTRGALGYGDTYGAGRDIGFPFYERYYAGGSGSLRGFRDNSLGPCEFVAAYAECQPTGGALKTVGALEFSIPGLLGKAGSGTQLALFLDAGNVFASPGTFDAGELRASTGLSLLWRSPMGPISISYGLPIRQQEGDDIERLQFNFGQRF